MRFNNRFTLKDSLGQKRTRRKFLWFPRQFGSTKTLWLEFANIIEEVREVSIVDGPWIWSEGYRWVEIGFADEEKNKQEEL